MDAMNAPSVIIEGKNIITVSIHERPSEERPSHDTIADIGTWLVDAARRNPHFVKILDEFAWRLVAAGIPLLRVSLHGGTLHPLFRAATHIWWGDTGQSREVMVAYEVADLIPYEVNPVRRVREGGETIRRRLEGNNEPFEFSILDELKARGGTDYFALPMPSPFDFGVYMVTFVSSRPGGFTDAEVADLRNLSYRLAVIADMNSQRQIARNVLNAYLGPRTGPRVLAGHIRRGGGERLSAVLWSSDLRGFTELSDHAPADTVIATLNDLFDLQALRIAEHGGEILKFIGDGLLAIFPVPTPADAPAAAANALAAARETLADLAARPTAEGEAPLRIVIALHYGEAIYGNIGAADRLDFTVIGPAVNLVSRIEAVAKSLDLPLVVSDDFVEAHGETSPSIGRHRLRGLERPHELFAPALGEVARVE